MKVIALLPFKNEAWILPAYLSSIKQIADEIIALDDGSTDGGDQLLLRNGAIVESLPSPSGEPIAMHGPSGTALY